MGSFNRSDFKKKLQEYTVALNGETQNLDEKTKAVRTNKKRGRTKRQHEKEKCRSNQN
jgi:hypothetical protein